MSPGLAGVLLPAVAVLLGGCAPQGPFTEPASIATPSEGSHLARGLILLRTGEPAHAHKAFVRAYRNGENPAEALTGAGLAMEARGLLTRARDYFTLARDLAPSSAVAHNNLGVVLYRLGDYSGAREAFHAAYAVSSGRNDIARANLVVVEEALALTAPEPPDPAITHSLRRMGTSEYLLEPLPAPAAEG